MSNTGQVKSSAAEIYDEFFRHISSAICSIVFVLNFASADASGNEAKPPLPPIEAGQTWIYLSPPAEYGTVVQVQGVSGNSVLVAVRDLAANGGAESAFQLVRIHMESLKQSLDAPGRPLVQGPSSTENAPYSCGNQPLNQCLNTIHSLRSLRAEDLYDR